jgi:hypothetical protein
LLDEISTSESVNWELKHSLTDILDSVIIYTVQKKLLIIFVYRKKYLYRVLVGTHEGKTPLGRPRRRWEDNIKMTFRKWDVGVWTGSSWLWIGTGGGQCSNEPSDSLKCWKFLE